MSEKQRYLPDSTTQQVEEPEPHTPASTPEVVFGMDQEILTRDLFPLEEDSFEVRLPFE